MVGLIRDSELLSGAADRLGAAAREVGRLGRDGARRVGWHVSSGRAGCGAALAAERTCLAGLARGGDAAARRRVADAARVASVAMALLNRVGPALVLVLVHGWLRRRRDDGALLVVLRRARRTGPSSCGAPPTPSPAAAFHSAYANSCINLAIFDPESASRARVAALVGAPAERLVHLFCVVLRQLLIHDALFFRYSDRDLLDHLARSCASLRATREGAASDPFEPWRRRVRSLLPAEGTTVKHIKTGDDVAVSRWLAVTFLMMTMADFGDQLRLEFAGDNQAALWPGEGKSGLWMNSISRMAALYSLIAREEEI
ncbi:hypothetical protein ACMD2_10247 [Ananas comosus]|uniref:DUF6817 domain-containing protein n=1 Tax=Ananas comosus TaxID=4615 RepID=A0A199VJP5_ANACO|nr:hypothetical protein ACMD2_10247 [Ananas comosus]